MLLLPVILLVFAYVFLIRPQQRRVRAQQELSTTLTAGEEVITVGGLVATVVEPADDDGRVRLQVAPGVVLTFVSAAIGRRVTPPAPEPEPEIERDVDPGAGAGESSDE